jgi:hypothetical protein
LLLSAAACFCLLLPATVCCCLLLSASVCCCLLLSAAVCCCLLLSAAAICCSLLLSAAVCCCYLLLLSAAAVCCCICICSLYVRFCPQSASVYFWLRSTSEHLPALIWASFWKQAGREQIESNDKLALRHTYEVLKRGWETELPLSYQVFLLMPLRHTPTVERLKDVMERISHMADVHEQHDGLLQKFRKATLRRLQDLEGKQWTEGQDILEFHPFEADETDMHKHPLYK